MIYVDATTITSDAGDGVHLSRAAGYAVAALVLDALVRPPDPPSLVCESAPIGLGPPLSDETLCR